MIPEEMEKTMAFILEHQADAAVRMQRLEEAQVRNDEQIAKLAALQSQGFQELTKLAELQAQGFQEMKEALAQTARDISALTKRIDRTSADVEHTGTYVREFIAEVRTWKPTKP